MAPKTQAELIWGLGQALWNTGIPALQQKARQVMDAAARQILPLVPDVTTKATRTPARVIPSPTAAAVQRAQQTQSQLRRQAINETYGGAAPRPRWSSSTQPTRQAAPPAAPAPAPRTEAVQLGLLKGQPGTVKYRYEAGTRSANAPLTKAGQPPKVGGQVYDPAVQAYGFAGGRAGTPPIQGPRGLMTRGGQQIEGQGLGVGPIPNMSLDEAIQRGLVQAPTGYPSLPVDFNRNVFQAPTLPASVAPQGIVSRSTVVPARSYAEGPQAPIPAWDLNAIRTAQGQGTVDTLEDLASRYSAYYNKPVSAIQINTPGFIAPRSQAMQEVERRLARNNPDLVDAASTFRVPRLGTPDPKAAGAVGLGAGLAAGLGAALTYDPQGVNTSATSDLSLVNNPAAPRVNDAAAQAEALSRLQAERAAAEQAGLRTGQPLAGLNYETPSVGSPPPGQPGSGQVVIRMDDRDSVQRQAAANAAAGTATFQPTPGSYENARDYYAARAGYVAQPGVMSNVMEQLVQQSPRMGDADMQAWAKANPALAYQLLQDSLPRGHSQQTPNIQDAEITTELGTNTANNVVGNTNEAVAATVGASPDLKNATDPNLRVSLKAMPRDMQAFYNRTGSRFANVSFR